MSDKRTNRLAESERMLAAFTALQKRADAHVKATAIAPEDPSIATALEIRKIASDQIDTLSHLQQQLAQDGGFLAGLSLWMGRSNLRRSEALMTKAEAERRSVMDKHNIGTDA